ncbi:anthranilate synthase component II [Helicobacter himalayensis]|uniref:anthranilate synthase component II n=1 Tax=Helicobacter himalayensis TaxID=1591088 RepID=UPI003D6F6E1D
MILLIDNYDSFSYNLYQLLGSFGVEIKVVRNDALNTQEILALKPSLIVLSPGPGKPEDAGVCIEVVKELGAQIPIFGVCLGHQAIVCAFGGKVSYAKSIMHGKTSLARLEGTSRLFAGFPDSMQVARYHSLCAIPPLPQCLKVTASTSDGEIMALEHESYPIFGVQFHPESILTPMGEKMIQNLLRLCKV